MEQEKMKNNKKIFIIIGVIVLIVAIAVISIMLLKKPNNETQPEEIILTEYESASVKAIEDYKNTLTNPQSLEVFEIRVYKKNATDIIIDCKEVNSNGTEIRKLVEYSLSDDGNVNYLTDTSKAGQTSSNFGEQLQITIANAIKEQWDTDTDYTLIDKDKVLTYLDKVNIDNEEGNITSVDFSKLEKALVDKDLINAVNEHSKMTSIKKNKQDTDKFVSLTNDLQALKEERKAELLTKVDTTYDDMTKESHYNFKGFDKYQENCVNEAINSGEKVIFQPAIIKSENNTFFYMIFTLLKDRWIFFDSMIFNIDGEITNISNNNFEKNTQTIGSGIVSEIAGMYLDKYSMFNSLVEKIINGKEVKIRFVGKDARGNVDIVLTETEKENLKTLYELSLCL